MSDNWQEAEERAVRRVGPRPKYNIASMAVLGGVAAYAVTFLFRMVVIPDPDPSGNASLIVVLIVAAACGLYGWSMERRYTKVFVEELERMEANKSRDTK